MTNRPKGIRPALKSPNQAPGRQGTTPTLAAVDELHTQPGRARRLRDALDRTRTLRRLARHNADTLDALAALADSGALQSWQIRLLARLLTTSPHLAPERTHL